MSRQFDLGKNGNISFLCISNNLFDLGLCIITSIFHSVISFPRVAANDGSISPGANLCKLWIFFYFNPPSLVLRQMPVKSIELVQGEIINIFFDEGYREEMTTHIEVHSPISKPGRIDDRYLRNF